jgi:hypothetical protein
MNEIQRRCCQYDTATHPSGELPGPSNAHRCT